MRLFLEDIKKFFRELIALFKKLFHRYFPTAIEDVKKTGRQVAEGLRDDNK